MLFQRCVFTGNLILLVVFLKSLILLKKIKSVFSFLYLGTFDMLVHGVSNGDLCQFPRVRPRTETQQ